MRRTEPDAGGPGADGACVPAFVPGDLFPALFASCPPAEAARVGPWCVRRGGGGGRRAQAVTLEGPLGDPAPAIARARAWGERPVFMVRGEPGLDALLKARGLGHEAETLIYAGPAAAIAGRRGGVTVIDCDGPLAVITDLWREMGIGPARLAVMERVAGPRRWLLGRLDDRPAGAAFVSAGAGAAMLNALHVVPWARRRGLGRRLTGWAAAWAADRGEASLALAVEAENAPARALYEGLGMAPAGRYHYRVAAPPPGAGADAGRMP